MFFSKEPNPLLLLNRKSNQNSRAASLLDSITGQDVQQTAELALACYLGSKAFKQSSSI